MDGDEAVALAQHCAVKAELARRHHPASVHRMHAPPFPPGLSPVAGKSLTATFDAARLSSDVRLVVLRAIQKRLGLVQTITALLLDERDQARILRRHADMAQMRMLMIAASEEDRDDTDARKDDSGLKIACGRAPRS